MLTKIHLENFKCFKKVTIDPKLITVFVGPNGSGKSSVLQALRLLKQSFSIPNRRGLVTKGNYIDLGSASELLYRGSAGNVIKIAIVGKAPLFQPDQVLLTDSVAWDLQSPQYELETHFEARYGVLEYIRQRILVPSFEILAEIDYRTHTRTAKPEKMQSAGAEIVLGMSEEPPFSLTFEIRVTGSDGKLRATIDEALKGLKAIIPQAIENNFLVPSKRGLNSPDYRLRQESSSDLSASVENLTAQEETLATTLVYSSDIGEKISIEQKISQWIQKVTEVRFRASAVEHNRAAISFAGSQGTINIVNEGYGSNQLTHLLGQLAVAPEDSVIGIEEPEMHLHPKAQANLVEVLIEVAKEEHKQLILTSHSEHIVFRLLTAIAEGELTPDDLAVYYFEKKDGEARAGLLAIDKKGRIEGGLETFFDAEIGAFKKYLDALSKKK